MKTKQLLGLIGSIILFIGVFTPIVSVPIMGNMNYFQNGKGDGTIVLILAVISLVLVLANKYKGLWFTGIGSLGVMLFTFINFQSKMSQAKADMETELAGNPFRGLADMAMQSVQLQWGWALMWQQSSGHISKQLLVALTHSPLDSYSHCWSAAAPGYKTLRYTRR
ncbi:hypothetical protein NYA30BAC_02536 [Halomonas sp. NYA30]